METKIDIKETKKTKSENVEYEIIEYNKFHKQCTKGMLYCFAGIVFVWGTTILYIYII